jgi:cytidylate kinase
MIIAIDGPAGSGKGTLARKLAKHYQITHLDSGLLYRALALKAGHMHDIDHLIPLANSLSHKDLMDPRLLTEEIGNAASQIAIIPEVRAIITGYIRKLCHELPGIVIDGRDIGTVVCANADIKIYVTARPDIRIERRLKELHNRGQHNDKVYEKLLKERDMRDQYRETAPLAMAEDALVLDTSELSIDDVFNKAIHVIDSKIRSKNEHSDS